MNFHLESINQQEPNNLYIGHLDECNRLSMVGWAWDANHPDDIIYLDIYCNESQIDTIKADTFRQDLLDHKIGDGRHGFIYIFNKEINQTAINSFRVKFNDTNIDLGGSPALVFNKSLESAFSKLDRNAFAELFLQGRGIEIGALNHPLKSL